jgi:thiamine-monophosphate kinase
MEGQVLVLSQCVARGQRDINSWTVAQSARLEIFQIPMPRKPQDEDSILRRIAGSSRTSRSHEAAQALKLGIGDDAALFRPRPGNETILTCDWFLEGTHFLREKHSPDSVGWKCLARALSDVAAMGGVPRCFLLSLALPESRTDRWLDLFLVGLRRASHKFQCPLAGGDTTRRSQILINVTVAGEVPRGRALLRSGARLGDILYVSGRLGEAELGLQLVRRSNGIASGKVSLTRKHLYPEPRLALGRWLLEKGFVSAMMDLSDGLSSDLPKLCTASSVGARLEMARIPQVSIPRIALEQHYNPLQLALHGGDDYELLFTVPPRKANRLPRLFQGLALTAIGRITDDREFLVLDEDGHPSRLVPRGWDPFRKKL